VQKISPCGAMVRIFLLILLVVGRAWSEDTSSSEPRRVEHDGIGANVQVSSTHKEDTGESDASALVDGDLDTRWSSEYSAPQSVVIELDDVSKVNGIRLHWEAAVATYYTISISKDGEKWQRIRRYFTTKREPGPRVDDIDLKQGVARWIRVDLLARVNRDWGYSLYDIEVHTEKAGDGAKPEQQNTVAPDQSGAEGSTGRSTPGPKN